MNKYHKIPSVFKRDVDGSKKLIEGEFESELVKYLKDNQWIFTEKVDGTNIRVNWDGHKVTFGGRTDNANIPADLMNRLIEIFVNDETEELFEQKFGETEITLYGEGYGPKIQKGGGLYRDNVDFIMFDAQIGDRWLEQDEAREIAQAFGLDFVPLVLTGTINDAVELVKTNPDSKIGSAKMEGVVGRPMVEMRDGHGKRAIVKIKCKDFK